MERKIKLIWDFRGPVAQKTAEHHEKHLKEYCQMEGYDAHKTGHTHFNDSFSTAYMVVPESRMIKVRDALKPHRGEVFQEPK